MISSNRRTPSLAAMAKPKTKSTSDNKAARRALWKIGTLPAKLACFKFLIPSAFKARSSAYSLFIVNLYAFADNSFPSSGRVSCFEPGHIAHQMSFGQQPKLQEERAVIPCRRRLTTGRGLRSGGDQGAPIADRRPRETYGVGTHLGLHHRGAQTRSCCSGISICAEDRILKGQWHGRPRRWRDRSGGPLRYYHRDAARIGRLAVPSSTRLAGSFFKSNLSRKS